jgi:hypothetical protein
MRSIIYFNDIATYQKIDFNTEILSVLNDDSKIKEQLINQIHINSSICKKKYEYLRYSVWLLFLSLLLFMNIIFIKGV